jgi:capsular polysaccharide biosynthesis protein
MKAVRDEGVVLIREVENAQRTYDAILQRFTQTTLEGQTTQSAVNVLTQAVAPLQPSSPNVMLNTVLAVFLGSLLAVGTALLLELMDRRVRNVDDVVDALGLPVLGVMPKPGAKLHLGGNRRSLLQQRLLAPLPAPATAAKGA